MRMIREFFLHENGENMVYLPLQYDILGAARFVKDTIVIWAEVDMAVTTQVQVAFHTFDTGKGIPFPNKEKLKYITSIHTFGKTTHLYYQEVSEGVYNAK